jgi:hypothetical protein
MKKHTTRRRYIPGTLLLRQQRDAIVLPAHIALDAIELGAGSIYHRHTLAAYLNIVGVCANRMVGAAQETRDAIDAAKYALVSADRRYLSTDKWGFSGPEMLCIRRAVTLSDALLMRVNSGMLSYAVDFVGRINDQTPEKLGMANAPLAERAAA